MQHPVNARGQRADEAFVTQVSFAPLDLSWERCGEAPVDNAHDGC